MFRRLRLGSCSHRWIQKASQTEGQEVHATEVEQDGGSSAPDGVEYGNHCNQASNNEDDVPCTRAPTLLNCAGEHIRCRHDKTSKQ